MSPIDTLQLLGSGAFTLIAAILYHAAFNVRRFGRYGREGLACGATLIMALVVLRTLLIFQVLSRTDASTINSIVAFIFLAILIQIGYIGWTNGIGVRRR